MYQIFSRFDTSKIQGRPMGMTVLLNFELHNDNLEQFNHAWEELRLSLDKNMFE